MKDHLENFIREHVEQPNETELQAILDIFYCDTCKKGTFFKERFSVSQYLGFIVEGSARLVLYPENGEEITIKLIQENSFITDVISIRSNRETPMGIQCIEDLSLLVAPVHEVQNLLDKNLTVNILFRKYVIDKALEIGENYIQFLSGTAKSRYQFIVNRYPNLIHRFPLRLVASIIGVTPTQLSRIRNNNHD